MENLSQNIKQARENVGMSQKTLAELLGVQTQTVWRWEKGDREPNWEMLQKIAQILNAPNLTEVFSEQGNKKNSSPIGLGYWGSVVDNAREVAQNGNVYDISLVETLLKSACDALAVGKGRIMQSSAAVPV